jgi:protein-tyrosine phosphatase
MMLPPGHGDSCLEVGQRFVISIYGTERVFTAEGENVHIRTYTGGSFQIWECVQNNKNHFGFTNVGAGKYLGRNFKHNAACFQTRLGVWERITFTRLSVGGYRLFLNVDGDLVAAQLESNSDGTYMKGVSSSNTIIGLHQLEDSVFRRFEWVISGRLARSSAPHYESHDENQNMDTVAVDFLTRHGITNVINVNSSPLSWTEFSSLLSNGITYTHISIDDFHAPTLSDFDSLNSSFTDSGTTLVCGGFGHGRTGTVISALQLYSGRRLCRSDFKANYVQTEEQFDALDKLKDKLEG